jgi:alkanesulfonate monooxygenase SsuD/methylene tetrahydromethanopterin reductase-like flavin-dependent oxidoreductase (luciferase family)
MRYGFVLALMEPTEAVELGRLAEEHGWDGVFMAEPVWGTDPWATLGAIAVATSRVRLGTMLTPPSRRRPWTLASQVATVDRLSGGRAILAVGLGALDSGFDAFGEVTDRRTRAELLDESLQIVAGLWSGEPFAFDGRHYHVAESSFFAGLPPVQRPRVPIWVVAAWHRPRSMARALRYDGILPCVVDHGEVRTLRPEELASLRRELEAERGSLDGFDLVVEGTTPADDPATAREAVAPWIEAGATWWIESNWEPYGRDGGAAILRERIVAGPPGAVSD